MVTRRPAVLTLRLATAAIWILFGLAFKVFDLVPRHRQIVAAFFGPDPFSWSSIKRPWGFRSIIVQLATSLVLLLHGLGLNFGY